MQIFIEIIFIYSSIEIIFLYSRENLDKELNF